MLRHGGVGIVHDFALHAAPELHRILVDELSLSRSFYLVRHASDRHSDRLARFATELTRRMKAEVARLEANTCLQMRP